MQTHPLLVNFNLKSRNLKHGKTKKHKWPKQSVIRLNQRSLKQRCLSWGKWPGSLSSLVLAMCLSKMPFWKRIPRQSKLKPDTYITRKKKTVRVCVICVWMCVVTGFMCVLYRGVYIIKEGWGLIFLWSFCPS